MTLDVPPPRAGFRLVGYRMTPPSRFHPARLVGEYEPERKGRDAG